MLTRRKVGQRARSRRDTLTLSQEVLAALAGVSRETIRGLEHGRITPNLATFGKIADVSQTSASTLLAEQPSEELTELVRPLPLRNQENVVVMLRALAGHLTLG